jgi:hypothetical protein
MVTAKESEVRDVGVAHLKTEMKHERGIVGMNGGY